MILKIAGTSAGGSSYSRRIMHRLDKMSKHQDLTIVITAGIAQKTVYHIVVNEILELYSFMGKRGGVIANRIEVHMEK